MSAAAGAQEHEQNVLLRGRGDLRHTGQEDELLLLADGTVVAGPLSGKIDPPEGSDYFMDEQASLRVVEIDRQKRLRGLLLTLPTAADEDPPNRYQLFVARGGSLVRILDTTLGVYGVTALEFSGDGAAVYVEDGWTACGRMKHPNKRVDQDRVTLTLNAAGTAMLETARAPSGQQQHCDDLAACPYVYLVQGDSAARVGEILRNLRGAAAYGRQELALPSVITDSLEIVIAEEKMEVTYLDEIYLEVDGKRVRPQACTGRDQPHYCSADRTPYRLGPAQRLELRFSMPRAAGSAKLWARGYYLPTPTLFSRDNNTSPN